MTRDHLVYSVVSNASLPVGSLTRASGRIHNPNYLHSKSHICCLFFFDPSSRFGAKTREVHASPWPAPRYILIVVERSLFSLPSCLLASLPPFPLISFPPPKRRKPLSSAPVITLSAIEPAHPACPIRCLFLLLILILLILHETQRPHLVSSHDGRS